MNQTKSVTPEQDARARYAAAAAVSEASPCCPVEYDQKYLEVISDEVVERDYKYGDSSRCAEGGSCC